MVPYRNRSLLKGCLTIASDKRMEGVIASALVPELVKDVATAIQEQRQYATQFRNQFEELKEHMIYVQSFLADACRKKHKNEMVKVVIHSLQELIYEADDLVVDCQIREDYQKSQGKSWCPSLSEMSFRYETGKKIAQINTQFQRIRENLISYYGPITAHPTSENNVDRMRSWNPQGYCQSEIVGLEQYAKTIKDWILNQSEPLLLIGIVDLGGLGKTTLAKKFFIDSTLTSGFQVKIWVSVSQPVNVAEIMKSILMQIGEKDSGSCEGDMLNRIVELLSDKAYLIILDDVWTSDDGWWEILSEWLPKTEVRQNCVIITSRIKNVVRKMGVTEERFYHPRLLDDNESWELFCKVARISANGEEQSLVDVGKEIVKRCGGSPLAIKTIGGLLSFKDPKSVPEWKRISENFHEKLTEDRYHSEGNMSVIASLQLIYDELPAYLKPCLLCFSIYPEDHEIYVEQLIHWWVGDGFVRSRNEETAKELALSYLSELINRCLVEVTPQGNLDGSVYTCKVNELVGELTIKIARDEEFCSFSERGKHIANVSYRRLGVGSDTKFQNLKGNSKLRALLLTATDHIPFSRDIELAGVHCLRVLDLSKVKLDGINLKDFWEWITSLKRLACLSLREVAKLYEVPSSIEKLWSLQVLILEECRSLKKLTTSIVKLPRLIFLNVGNCPQLKCLPQGFSRLFNLQELYGFKIAGSENAVGSCLGELGYLTKLRALQIDITEESRIQDEELQVLASLQKLKLLSINAGDCQESRYNDILTKLDKLSPPPSVEELYLERYVGETMPAWINPKSLPKLQYLSVERSEVKKMSRYFWGDGQCKWDVKRLCLRFCHRLQFSWKELKEAMPEIRYLEVCRCNSLQDFPFDVTAVGVWKIEST